MRKLYILGLIALAGIIIGFAWAEQITLTTYYPAPYGVYRELTTTSNTFLARDSGNVGIGTATPDATFEVQGTVKVLGDWELKNCGQIHSAATDGFVCAYKGPGGLTAAGPSLQGFTDGNADPTTMVQYSAPYVHSNVASIAFPVKKGDNWKVIESPPLGTSGHVPAVLYWIPFGS